MRTAKEFLTVSLFIMCVHSIQAQKVYGYIFCNTLDSSLADPSEINYAKVKLLFMDIATSLPGYTYVDRSLFGNEFDEQRIKATLKKDKFTTDDIVLFYINTHGLSNQLAEESLFPLVKVPQNKFLKSFEFFNSLYMRKPKICIALIEACNGYAKQDTFQIKQEAFLQMDDIVFETVDVDALRQQAAKNMLVLMGSKTNFIVTASQRGADSFALGNGSIFTNMFIRAFNETLRTPTAKDVSWKAVLERSKTLTQDRTRSMPNNPHPVWQLYDNGIVRQSAPDTAVQYAKLKIYVDQKAKLPWHSVQWYTVSLSVTSSTSLEIDYVKYFLDHSMEEPVVTDRSYNDRFLYSFGVFREYPIKAQVFFKDGMVQELYGNIQFPR